MPDPPSIITTPMIAVRIAAILAFTAASLAAQSPIAGVDVGRAYRSYHRTISTMEEIANQRRQIEQDQRLEQLKQLGQQVKEAENAAAKLVAGDQEAWLDARRLAELKREEFRAAARALQESRDTATKNLNHELVTLSRKLLNDVHQAAAEIGDKRGYELVIDSTGNTNTGMPLLLYSRRLPDLTEAVITRLNADAPGQDQDEAGEDIPAEDDPDKPSDPDKPDDPDKPNDPDNPDGDKPPADETPPKAIRVAGQNPEAGPAAGGQ